MTALAVLEAADLVPWPAPQFDNCLWEATGAYVEVWSSAGAVTTTRLARGEAALPALALVLVGLLPVILLSRTLRSR